MDLTSGVRRKRTFRFHLPAIFSMKGPVIARLGVTIRDLEADPAGWPRVSGKAANHAACRVQSSVRMTAAATELGFGNRCMNRREALQDLILDVLIGSVRVTAVTELFGLGNRFGNRREALQDWI
jgi:hypothetical protein